MGTLGDLVGKPTHIMPVVHNAFVIPHAKVGVEVEAEGVKATKGLNRNLWATKTDGSLRDNGQEFVTVDGLVGQHLFDAIHNICDVAKANKYTDGYPRAGIHIHLDCTDLNVEDRQLQRLVTNYMLVEHLLFDFCGNWRRDCGYCVPYDTGKNDFDIIGRALSAKDVGDSSKSNARVLFSHMSKYQSLNLRPLIDLGTVEFRTLPTTFDVDRILLWINIILSIKKSAADKAFAEPLKLLSTVGPQRFVERILGADIMKAMYAEIDERKLWTAVDNVSTILAIGDQQGIRGVQKKRMNSNMLSEVMVKRIEAQKKAKNKEIKVFLPPPDTERELNALEATISDRYPNFYNISRQRNADPEIIRWMDLARPYKLTIWPDDEHLVEYGLLPRVVEYREDRMLHRQEQEARVAGANAPADDDAIFGRPAFEVEEAPVAQAVQPQVAAPRVRIHPMPRPQAAPNFPDWVELERNMELNRRAQQGGAPPLVPRAPRPRQR